jgi:3-mercaptopyruvate sulfurtransferase SseA
MLANPKSIFLTAIAGCILFAPPSGAADGVSGNLVNVSWLEKNLQNTNLLILDASPAQNYREGHIPGAINVDMLAYGRPEISAAEMEKTLRSWGVSLGKTVVMYDQGGNMMATRIFYSLEYYGFPAKDMFVLDGGSYKWQSAGLPVTKESAPAPKPGTFTIAKLNRDAKAELPEVLAATGDTANTALVEALGADWHYGQVAPFNRAGHIPNGILLPSTDFYNADKTFKSPEEIRKMLAYFDIRPEQRIYTYCGGGIAASVPYFALKFILNYPSVKLYEASELGWLGDERDLPYWTYDAPYLMRDSAWLQFWGGGMLRMFGAPRVIVVDVRPKALYDQGHMPYAVNIPAEGFEDNLSNPRKMVEILSQAGVDPALEAVVVSGTGLTKETALAYAVLMRLKQNKVSIFMDSMEKAAKAGFALTKNATIVGQPKSPTDLAIPSVTYPLAVRRNIITQDLSTPGVYPRVFIASGKNLPTQAQDGKVIHLPYTELVNADGSPKAAKDIWKTLTKAGVPRYAQLVFVSDDTGEAALNYLIFKLMGFPDLRILVSDCGCAMVGPQGD